MFDSIARVASQLAFTVMAMTVTTLIIQRTTVVHSFDPVPQEQRAAIRFCPDDPWRLTVKNLSFISVPGLKVAYVYRGVTDAKIETDRDWTLYPNGPTERKDSGHYYSWDLGNQLAGETVNIVFCFPKGLKESDIRRVAASGRPRMFVRTDNANSIDITESPTKALIDAPLFIILIGWLVTLGASLYLFIKLVSLIFRVMRRGDDEKPQPAPSTEEAANKT